MKNKQLLAIVAILGLCGANVLLPGESFKQTAREMYDNHFKKTVVGGYCAARGLWKMKQGIYGYWDDVPLVKPVKMCVVKNGKEVLIPTWEQWPRVYKGTILPSLRRGSVGAVGGLGLLAYSFAQSWPSKDK